MKKLIIIALSLLVLSGLVATELKYWQTVVYLQTIPRQWSDGDISTRAATVFTPAANCKLEGVYFPFYGGGATGQANVRVEIWPVNPDGTPDQSAWLPLAGETIPYTNLINWQVAGEFNYVDFYDADLYFGPTAVDGTKFAMVVSTPNGLVNVRETATLHDDAYRANSFNYFITDPVGWDAWYDYCFSAEITYTGEVVDLEASTLYFSGDFFLEPNQEIDYVMEVTNNSVGSDGLPMEVDDVGLYLVIREREDFSNIVAWIGYAEEQTIPAGATLQYSLPNPYVFGLDPGRYIVQYQVWHDDDVDMNDNNLFLQQDVVELPHEFAYDEGWGDNAYAFNNAGFAFANSFWYSGADIKINAIKFELWDNTWPANAQGNLNYAIYPDDGTGLPDMDNPLVPFTPATCTLGEWNTYDVSSYNRVIPAGEPFYVAYFQEGILGQGAPGLCVDEVLPFSSWATSWAYSPETGWESPIFVEEDLCIRVIAEEVIQIVEVDTPENVTIYLDGYPVVSWDAVEGAQSYNVYGSDDPYTPMSEWTLLEAGIQDLGYYYEGEEDFQFFVVTASSEFDGSKGRSASEPVAFKASKKIDNPNIIKKIDQLQSIKVELDTEINRTVDKNSKIPAGFGARNLIKR